MRMTCLSLSGRRKPALGTVARDIGAARGTQGAAVECDMMPDGCRGP